MQKNEFVDIQIAFTNLEMTYQVGEKVEGKIYVRPYRTLQIVKLELDVKWQVRGLLNVGETLVHSIKVCGSTTWVKGNSYEYDFSFEVSHPSSFRGKYLHIRWAAGTEVYLSEESRRELGSEHLKAFRILDWWNPENDLESTVFFKVIPSRQQQVLPVEMELGFSPFFVFSAVAFVLMLALSIASGFGHVVFNVLLLVATGFFVFSLIDWLSGKSQLGNIMLSLKPKEGFFFEANISIEKKWESLEGISVNYALYEKVVDRRGTQSTTHKSQYFRSKPVYTKEVISDSNSINIPIPEIDLPSTFSYKNSEIYWKIFVHFNFKNGIESASEKTLVIL